MTPREVEEAIKENADTLCDIIRQMGGMTVVQLTVIHVTLESYLNELASEYPDLAEKVELLIGINLAALADFVAHIKHKDFQLS